MRSTFPTRLALLALGGALAVPALTQGRPVPRPDGDDGGLRLPTGFRALVVADGLGRARFLAVSPAGDVYVKIRDGGIVALRDADGDGRAEVRETFGAGGGSAVAVRDGWLYHSTNSAVLRYRLAPGELVPKGEPETIVSGLPDARTHNTKAFAFDPEGRLLVEVGSPSNALGEPDRARGAKGKDPAEFLETHGGFWRFDANRPGQTQRDGVRVSTGHRHVLAFDWNPVSKAFFLVQMGRDQLDTVAPEHYSADDNAELPAEELHVLREGMDLGWPKTYWDPVRKARMLAPEYGGDKVTKAPAGGHPDPLVAFPAHWAPMQMAFTRGTQFPARYQGGAFVSFHGSWNRAPRPQKGFNVAFVPFDAKGMPVGTYEVFADGFAGAAEVLKPAEARFRPAGLAFGPDGSLYVSDSQKGRVWRIVYAGDGASPAAPSPAARPSPSPVAPKAAAPAAADPSAGARLYAESCAVCHMEDGSGVPGLNPALKGSKVLAGPAGPLARWVLLGSSGFPDRRDAENQMPGFDTLEDREIADLLTFARRRFARVTRPVTAAQVAAERARK